MNKKHLIILLMAFCLSLSSCVSTRDTVRVNNIHRYLQYKWEGHRI